MNWKRKLCAAGMGLIAAGLLICGCVWVWSGVNPFEENTTEYETVELTLGGVETLSVTIEETNSEVLLERSEDGKIRVTGQEREDDRLEVVRNEDGGVLVRRSRNAEWYDMVAFFPNEPERTTVVSLPAEYEGDVSVRTDNGGVAAVDNCTAGSLTLTSDNGRVEAKNQTPAELIIETSNGKIVLTDVRTGGDVYARTSNGAVSIQNLFAEGTVEIQTSNGRLDFSGINASQMTAKSSNGRIFAGDITAEGKIDIRTSNGGIELARVQGMDIRLETSNGSITGTIAGDEAEYEISTETGSGEVRMPTGRTGADRKLTVLTGNGDVSLEFEE